MLLSSWKSREELEFMLNGMRQVAVFSCSFCANLNGTGGPEALGRMKELLKDLGIKAVVVKTVNICCSEEIMKQAVRIHLSRVRGKCDGLVMMSCAGGVKNAFLCDPGMPVIAALDSMGSGVITRKKDPVADSHCMACGHCVIAYTGGICPVSECPARKKYGPCFKSHDSETCAVDATKPCIWREIEKRGNPDLLKALENLHKNLAYERMPAVHRKPTPGFMRTFSGWFMARIPGISRFVNLID